MRFNLTLRVNARKYGRILPLNYQYEMSAVIYKILASSSGDFATWLHENGFRMDNGKQFKLFTFSQLNIPNRRILKQSNQLELLSDSVQWQISFLPENSTQNFIEGLFQNCVFEIGNKESKVEFEVESIEVVPPPEFQESMVYNTLSPIFVSCVDETGRDHYPKDSHEFKTSEWVKERLLINLVDKYSAFYGREFQDEKYLNFITLTEPKSKLVTIKSGTNEQTRLRGFECKIVVSAPPELQRLAYDSGLGALNSQGFGCLEVL